MPEGCCQKVQSKVHIDSLIDGIANNCPKMERIEARWDSDTLRFSDRSSKAIDAIRIKCLKLKCLVLSDGTYFEMVKSNFDRADRTTVVRWAFFVIQYVESDLTSLASLFQICDELRGHPGLSAAIL